MQELLRRATPQSLRRANSLIKKMAEGEADIVTDLSKELEAIENKVYILMDSDRTQEIALEIEDECKNAQIKIQKIIQEDQDHPMLEKLLSVNDLLQKAINGETSREEICSNDGPISLIDFEDNENSLEHDLLNLEIEEGIILHECAEGIIRFQSTVKDKEGLGCFIFKAKSLIENLEVEIAVVKQSKLELGILESNVIKPNQKLEYRFKVIGENQKLKYKIRFGEQNFQDVLDLRYQ